VPDVNHRLRQMSGRDPDEQFRVATPLELLFDLTFVVGFGTAASQFARALSENHIGSGLAGFVFATFAVWWAWVNFSWFAWAYDTDDWVYRLTTMVQMAGVIILALGVPAMFASIEGGQHVDNRVMVAGYVVIRIAMVAQWLRAAAQDPTHRPACMTYAATVTVAQIGWVGLIFARTSLLVTFLLMVPLFVIELAGPWIAETRKGGTPWHAHHIVERYGLLTIIALGEGVVGTVASLSAVVAAQGWSRDAFHLVLVALTAVMLVASVALAAGGLSMATCLVIVMIAPMVTVAGFELIGHRHAAEAVSRSLAQGG
jgi:low temperature requirement protein LtrA